MKVHINTVAEAIEDIKQGKIVIVVDDEDRENEGDFIVAAEKITPEIVNFMASEGKGLICVAISEARCDQLELELMPGKHNGTNQTSFTVSVDLNHPEVTTGISASDRALTIQALADPNMTPEKFARPGHIFPLKAKEKGVLRRAGHTEAAVDLARLAGLEPAGALVEIMNEDGTMARMPDLVKIAEKFKLKIVTIESLIAHVIQKESIIIKGEEVNLPTSFGDFRLIPFIQKSNGLEHVALIKGDWKKDEPVLVRVHSSCVTGDIFGSLRCDCGPQLQRAMQMLEKEGKGVIIYLNQEGRGIGLFNKIKAYKLQEQGVDTLQANLDLGFKGDERDYGVGAGMLREIGVTNIKLITNNPTKKAGLEGYGLKIVDNVSLRIEPNEHNQDYMETKQNKMGHFLNLISYKKESSED